jgi:hypothetical protein
MTLYSRFTWSRFNSIHVNIIVNKRKSRECYESTVYCLPKPAKMGLMLLFRKEIYPLVDHLSLIPSNDVVHIYDMRRLCYNAVQGKINKSLCL